MQTKMKVLFRKDRRGEITAVFPSVYTYMDCYSHVGQHSTCTADWVIEWTRNAKTEEYADLKRELEAAPYKYKLVVGKRMGKR